MSVLSSLFRLPTVRHVVKKPGVNWSYSKSRSFADKRKTEINKDKQSVSQQKVLISEKVPCHRISHRATDHTYKLNYTS